jgi:two-component system, NarL family, sensor histidine kinase FusK
MKQSAREVRDHERQRIARDIHDDLGQSLLVLKLELGRLCNSVGGPLGSQVDQLIRHVDATMLSLRTIVHDLRTPALEMGLSDAVQRQLDDFSRITGVGHRLQITPQLDDVTPTAGIVVFRTLQELLANVARHAKASQVQVDLDTDAANGLTLRVQDDGIGIGPVPRPGACGLHGMRERIRDAGGSLDIGSNGGSGTCVTVSLPRDH